MATLMNRRQWLKTGALAAAGAAVGRDLPALARHAPAARRAFDGPIRLHSNENAFGPSAAARQAMQAAFDDGCRYPGSFYGALEALIAEREGLTAEHVVLGGGSHEVLRMAGMAYGLDGGEVLTAYPTYEGMENYAASVGAYVHRVPLDDAFLVDLDAMDRRTTQAVKLVFLCNPNNPTGTMLPGEQVRAFCEAVSRRAVVLVDEAYHEYVTDPAYASMTDLVRRGHNVIVSRTFSKIFGLAGLRVGYGLARPDLAERLRRFRGGSSVNVLGLRAAAASYRDADFVAFSRARNAEARAFATTLLEDRGHRCLPSHTNFVFFHLRRDVRAFAEQMRQQGILVGRPFPPFLDWCRLSLGTMDEMRAFAAAFEAVMTQP